MNSWRKFYMETNRRRECLFWGSLILLLLLAIVFSVCFGTVTIDPRELFAVLLGSETDSIYARILLYTRLPRCIGSIFAGAALAVAGAVIQSVLANPLAAPHVIGVNSAAGFITALCCALFPHAWSLLPFMAFCGAFFGVMVVTLISERADASKLSLVLAGVAVSNIFSAGIDVVITLVPDALTGYTDFKIGGFSGITMERMLPALILIVVGIAAAVMLSKELDILALGSETAQSLGLPVKHVRILFLLIVAALSGAAISFAGLLGFVGLIVPHIMRRFVGEESKPLILSSAFGGAILVSFCDFLARTLFSPYEISVGIVMSFIGGPFFLWLIFRLRRQQL